MLLRFIYQQHSTANRKKRSSSSFMRTGTSFHGSLLTCQVYPGDWLSTICESTQRQNPLKSISVCLPRRREKRLVRRWLGFWLPSSSTRYTTPSGSPTSLWSPRNINHFECVLISSTSIRPARKIISLPPPPHRPDCRLNCGV